jgi:eukaryotic-like serine/threonine-protein kinase
MLDRLTAALADRYRLERELGAGGMATVYLAQDLKHDRKVAVKVLRPELAAVIGAERFLSEIKTTANLQHPHILPLFDSGAADSFLFYVMPFVEGESLRDRLNREKQLPISDAVRIATEVASALDYAHRHNVIHRDIKPENILLHDGRALVADFGIALAASKPGGTRMTETGMSLGTPTYMSPEQAMGEREITARSDVYALGCVTYEMLVGEPPFTGPTAQAIVAKVMTAEPADITGQRRTVPPHVDAAVLTALEKLPADRFATAAEFAEALAGRSVSGRTTTTARRPNAAGPWRAVSAVLGILVLALLGLAAWNFARRPAAAGPAVYDAALPDSAPVIFAARTAGISYGISFRNLSIAPTGDFVVYAGGQGDSTELWYRSLRDAAAHPIAGTRGGTAPRISPDGKRVAFLVGQQIMAVPVGGGEPRRLLDATATSTMDWVSPTQVIATDMDGYRLSRLDVDAVTARSAQTPRCLYGQWEPVLRILVCSVNRNGSVVDPDSGSTVLIRSARQDGRAGPPVVGTAFRVVDQRYLLYLTLDGTLAAAPYDPETHLAGRPTSLLSGVRREAVGEAHYDIAANGSLIYAPGMDATIGRLVSLRAGGTPVPFPMESGDFQRYDLSPNRRWMAVAAQSQEGMELRVYDLRDGQRFTWLRDEFVRHPLWSPDGETLLIGVRDSSRWAILRGSPSPGARPDTLFTAPWDGTSPDPADYQGEHSALAQNWVGSVTMRFDPTAQTAKLDTVVTGSRFASVSPNGKLIMYQTMEGQVITAPFSAPGRRRQVASAGVEPLWLSATTVLYRAGVSWYTVQVNPETGEPQGAPTYWARDPRFSDTAGWSNRLSHDGGIIYLQGPAQTSASYLRVIPNWVSQMKAAVDAAN